MTWEDILRGAILETGTKITIQHRGADIKAIAGIKFVHKSVYVTEELTLLAGDAVLYAPHDTTGFEVGDTVVIRNKQFRIAHVQDYYYRFPGDEENVKYYWVLFLQHPQNYRREEEPDGYSIYGDDFYLRHWTNYNYSKLEIYERLHLSEWRTFTTTPGEPGEPEDVARVFSQTMDLGRPAYTENFTDFPESLAALEEAWEIVFLEEFEAEGWEPTIDTITPEHNTVFEEEFEAEGWEPDIEVPLEPEFEEEFELAWADYNSLRPTTVLVLEGFDDF